MLLLPFSVVGKSALKWCKPAGLSCSSVLRAAGVWCCRAAESYEISTSWYAGCQYREQTELTSAGHHSDYQHHNPFGCCMYKMYIWFICE